MSKLKISLFALLSGLTLARLCAQSAPPLVNYQGRLANPDGSLLPTADYELTFRIWDAPTNGALVWGPQLFDGGIGAGHGAKVPVVQGYFNVVLGPVDTNGTSLAMAFAASNRFVEITVGNRPPILPRQQIVSTPYALTAGSLIRDLQEALCPPGTITAFGGHTNRIPAGWLLCNGRAVNSGVFPRLHLAISTNWGAGTMAVDGTNDFSLPDLQGMFLRGAGQNLIPAYQYQGDVSRLSGSLQGDQFQDHEHYSADVHNGYAVRYFVAGSDRVGVSPDPPDPPPAGLQDVRLATSAPISGIHGAETRPKNAAVNYIIKY